MAFVDQYDGFFEITPIFIEGPSTRGKKRCGSREKNVSSRRIARLRLYCGMAIDRDEGNWRCTPWSPSGGNDRKGRPSASAKRSRFVAGRATSTCWRGLSPARAGRVSTLALRPARGSGPCLNAVVLVQA